MSPELTLEFIEKLPKTDLHCHLDGSLRLDTILDLARKQRVKLPTFDRDELFQLVYAGEKCTSLEDYLKGFDVTLSVLQTEESLERVAFELAEDAWKENVRYPEVRYSPLLHTREGLRPAVVVEAVIRILTVQQGPGQVLAAMKVKFKPGLTTGGQLCDVINQFEARLEAKVPEVKWTFIEPDLTD